MKPELTKSHKSPVRLFMGIIAAIFIAEVIAMIMVYLLRPLPYPLTVLIDASIMTVLIFPILYLFSTRPLLKHIQQRTQTENILQARLRLIEYANGHTLDELLQLALDEIETLTGSHIGYFHFLEADQKTLWLRTWSSNTLKRMCTLEGKNSHYDVDQAGVWTDCIRARRPVIHNDYASLPHRHGLPQEHVPVIREIAVPIIREGKIVAVLGLGNKPSPYTDNDVEIISTLADFAWEQIIHKQAGDELLKSEEKFRTLADWTYDWELWVNPQEVLIYTSPSCKHFTGYSPEDFAADPELMRNIVHAKDRAIFDEHLNHTHTESAGIEKLEYRITTRQANERWIEHICRPLFGTDNSYLGRRVSNRDITERKRAEKLLQERYQTERLLTQTIHTMQLDIARDLHDTLGQNISFLRMKLDYLAENKIRKQAEIQREIEGMAQAANESYDLMRGTLAVLQAENSTDLFGLFSRYAEQIEERSCFKMKFFNQGEPRFIPARRMRQLFYIFREILNNIEKHADATDVCMEMNWGQDSLLLAVSDNGNGFEPENVRFGGHYGLKFMRERADLLNGSLMVRSAPGSGTHIHLQVPYD